MRRLRTLSTYRRRLRSLRSNPHSVVSCYSSWRLCILCKCNAIYRLFPSNQTTNKYVHTQARVHKQYVNAQVRRRQYVYTKVLIVKQYVQYTSS